MFNLSPSIKFTWINVWNTLNGIKHTALNNSFNQNGVTIYNTVTIRNSAQKKILVEHFIYNFGCLFF